MSVDSWRYPLVGGMRQRRFVGTNSKPCKLPENAARTHRQLHVVLGAATQDGLPVLRDGIKEDSTSL